MIVSLQRNVIFSYVAFFVLSGIISLTAPARAADWPQFRGNQPSTATVSASSGRLLVPLWTKRLPSIAISGRTYSGSITGTAAIVNGSVYVGSKNTRFYAMDARTGAPRWEYDTGREIESSPLVKDGAVYFVPYNGNLTSLNVADGSVRWIHTSGGVLDRASPNYSAGNIIGAASFPKTSIYAVPENSPNPAAEAWHADTQQFIYSSPTVDPQTQNIFCPSDDGRLYALKPDGTALWPQPYQMSGGVFRASATVANGKVYVTSGDYDWALHAIDAATGQLVWDAPMVPLPTYSSNYYRAIQVSSPAADGDFVTIVGGYGNNLGPSTLYAFRDKGTSVETLWTADLPNYVTDSYVSSPVLTPTDVVVGVAARTDPANPTHPRGRVYIVDRATGKSTWYAAGDLGNAGGPIYASPAIADDLVVVGDTSGLLTTYQMVHPGDVDRDEKVTALDALQMMSPASSNGQATTAVRYRGDLLPANTVPSDAARSFGDGLVTPADADLVLQKAIGLS